MTVDKNLPNQHDYLLGSQKQNQTQFGLKSISSAEEKRKTSGEPENQFQILIEKASVPIFVIQAEEICYANPVAKLIMGHSQFGTISSSRGLCSSANSSLHHQLNPYSYNRDKLISNHCQELKIKVLDGSECWLNCCWETIEWQYQPAIMVTATDITKYKDREASIHQALRAEKELNQNKTNFVAMISHEFRTPLNIISFSTSLLKRHLDQWHRDKQLKYLNRLQTSVEQLCNLMDEVLIIGKVDAGKLKFNPQLLNLSSFCHSLLAEMNLSKLDYARINFVNLLDQETILADKSLLKLVLTNLLGNAIKYSSDNNTVEFIVSYNCQQIIFKIIDRGIGISADQQSQIFEPFHRGDNVGDIPGSGLGLAITKKIIDLQGGQIYLESEINKGSTFIVKIPFVSSQIKVGL